MGSRYQGTQEERRALDAFVKLQRAAEALNTRLNRASAGSGLTTSQFGVLEALLHLGPLCQTELGDKILKSTGNITMVVDNLEKRGLVRRERSTEDRRYVTVHLTDDGRRLIEELFPRRAADITCEMAILSPEEQAELGRLCRIVGRGSRT